MGVGNAALFVSGAGARSPQGRQARREDVWKVDRARQAKNPQTQACVPEDGQKPMY